MDNTSNRVHRQTTDMITAIRSAGFIPPDHIEAGRVHRFPGAGKKNGNTAGWCILFEDGQGGMFGDWSTGMQEIWQVKKEKQSPEESVRLRKQITEAKKLAEVERKKSQAEAARKAVSIWNQSATVTDHPYLTKKGVKPHGLRVNENSLVVPLRDESGKINSLQFVGPDGEKRFLTGSRVTSCYFSIGRPDKTLFVAEGYATGASIHEATGEAVAIAFNAGNLKPVAETLRKKFPDIKIILAGDNDVNKTGQDKAKEAAKAIGGVVAIPHETGDWNDYTAKHGKDALKQVIDAAIPTPITYRRMTDIKAVPVNWLWPGRIARGKTTTLAGDPGLGKSQLASSMAAIVSTGGLWPVDRTQAETGNIIILSAEDDAGDTTRPRLEATRADLNRIFVIDAVPEGDTEREFNLTKDISRLGELISRIGNVALVIIDPISAYLGGTDSHKNADVRALLSPLGKLAAAHNTAIVCVTHLNKSTGGNALSRFTGSLAFVAAARAAYVVTRDPDDETRRLFLPAKNNIGPDNTGLAYRIESTTVNDIETCRIVWDSDPVTLTADEALTQIPDEQSTALDEAVDWLESILTDEGTMRKQEIMKIARKEGHSERTVHRARQELNLMVKTEGFGKEKKSLWSLPDQSCHTPRQNLGTNDNLAQTPINKGFSDGDNTQSCHSCQDNGTGTNGMHGDPEAF